MLRRLIIGFAGIISLVGCITKSTLGEQYILFPSQELIYTNSQGKKSRLTEMEKIDEIITIINTAKRLPTKFIAIEEIVIRRMEDDTLIIARRQEYLRINGITFKLSNNSNKKLNNLID